MDSKFAITVLVDDCAFSAEILRSAIPPSIAIINEDLDEQGFDLTSDLRAAAVVNDAIDLADGILGGEIDREVAVSEIAINFIYAFLTQSKQTDLNDVYGMLVCARGDVFNAQPYFTQESYDEAAEAFREVTKVYLGGEDEDDPPPTIH